jgi:hypothetical protein
MSNTNNIIIEDENEEFGGSGSGDITGEVTDVVSTPNYVDVDTLSLVPLSGLVPEENDILVYDGSFYAPQSLVLSLLEDVTIVAEENANVITYNSTTSKWENVDLSTIIDDSIQFDSIANPASQDILSYNGTQWVPITRESLLTSFPLTNISDVLIDTQINGQLLSYNSSSSKWENKTIGLYDLSEISTTGLQNNELLIYNTTTSKWENTELTLNHLSNFSSGGENNTDLLNYNSATNKWEAISLEDLASSTAVETDLAELKNVTILNKQDNQFLSWDVATQKWINHTPSLVDLSDYNSSNAPNNKDILQWESSSSTWKSIPLEVKDLFGYELAELAVGKTLVYDTDLSKWVPTLLTIQDIAERGIDMSSVQNMSGLYWNSSEQKWDITKRSFEDILDINGVTDNQILSFDSTSETWGAVNISDIIQLSQNIDALNDVTITSASSNEALLWDLASEKWINRELTLSDIKNINLAGIANKGTLVYNNVQSKWEVKIIKLETLINESLDTNTFEDNSTIHWNSMSDEWEVKNPSLEDILGFSNSIDDNSVIVFDKDNLVWTTDVVSNLFSFSDDIESLLDVNLNTLEDSQILVYNNGNSKWENLDLTLELLSNINVSGIANGNMLAWNSSLSRWEPEDINTLISTRFGLENLASLNDLTITAAAESELLSYNSSDSTWINTTLTPSSFKELDLTGHSENKYLTWNIGESKWEFKTYSFLDAFNIDTGTLVEGNVLIWDATIPGWKSIEAHELSDHVAQEIDLGELKNVTAPNKLNNQILTWDSALQVWMPKNVSDLGVLLSGTLDITGNDWVTIFNNELNY